VRSLRVAVGPNYDLGKRASRPRNLLFGRKWQRNRTNNQSVPSQRSSVILALAAGVVGIATLVLALGTYLDDDRVSDPRLIVDGEEVEPITEESFGEVLDGDETVATDGGHEA
jgi:hypothetical protein